MLSTCVHSPSTARLQRCASGTRSGYNHVTHGYFNPQPYHPWSNRSCLSQPPPTSKVVQCRASSTEESSSTVVQDASSNTDSPSDVSAPSTSPEAGPFPLLSSLSDAQSTAKSALLELVSGLQRGAAAGLEERGEVEEAQVALEAFGGEELDWDLLPGTWELIYTTANDVLPILGAESFLSLPVIGPVIEVGLVGQRFIATAPGFGRVENIVQLGVKPWLQPKDGLTTLVTATYEQRGPHTLRLAFERAQVGEIKLSPLSQALLAPAIFPRFQIQQSLLLAVQEFVFRIQFQTAQEAAQGRGAGGGYQLTYLDQDVLIGRAENSGGTFMFTRKE